MDFRIVPITERHIEGFRSVVDRVARERRYLAILRGFPPKETRRFVRASMRARNPHLLAVVGRRVVGWCDIQRIPRDAMAHSGILGIGIVDGFRRQGIGRALMHAALMRARRSGLTRVELTVREDNRRAIALYRKFGFVAEGVKRNGFRVDGRYYNVVSMAVLFGRSCKS
jgi:RimJ/RimL family protein N-acetyltransferase